MSWINISAGVFLMFYFWSFYKASFNTIMAQAVHLASCKQCGLAQISKNLFSVWCVYNCLFSVMCVHVLGQDGLAFLHCCPPSSLETQPFADPREPLSPHTGAVTPVLLIG